MKPSLFEYCAPGTIEEAISVLEADADAVVLAGGQSLIPAMNLRLANPAKLVDLRKIEGLSDIVNDEGVIRVGAMVRHRDLELNQDVFEANGLIREAERHVAHVPIRNRGTVVGSLCHADAAAEMPLVLLVCDGSVVATGPSGKREIAAADFFQFHMTTTREADEVITEARIPVLPDGAGYAFSEFARRRGDYAIAAVATIVECGEDGVISRCAIGACGIGERPLRLNEVELAIEGKSADSSGISAAADLSAEYVTAPDDMHATTAYRQHLLKGLVERALTAAVARARGEQS